MFGWFRRQFDDLFGRSSKWSEVRAEHLKREPRCRVCGSDRDMEVHHILPYGEDAGRELDPANLISCCHDCHFVVAHAGNWRTYRPDIVRLANTIRAAEVRRIG